MKKVEKQYKNVDGESILAKLDEPIAMPGSRRVITQRSGLAAKGKLQKRASGRRVRLRESGRGRLWQQNCLEKLMLRPFAEPFLQMAA